MVVALALEVREALEDEANIAGDPGTAIDRPEFVTRCVVASSIRMFAELSGRAPRIIHVPKNLEVSLQVDLARMKGDHRGLRKARPVLFGCKPVWDAASFHLE